MSQVPKYKVITYDNDPDSILRKQSESIDIPSSLEILELARQMAITMYNNKGIGLAAPQIGQSIRLVVVDVGHGLISLANPVIIKMTGKMNSFEGCLSFPKKFFTVGRAKQIKVRGYDIFLRKEITLKYHSLEAAALQHEIDHLDGVLVADVNRQQQRDH